MTKQRSRSLEKLNSLEHTARPFDQTSYILHLTANLYWQVFTNPVFLSISSHVVCLFVYLCMCIWVCVFVFVYLCIWVCVWQVFTNPVLSSISSHVVFLFVYFCICVFVFLCIWACVFVYLSLCMAGQHRPCPFFKCIMLCVFKVVVRRPLWIDFHCIGFLKSDLVASCVTFYIRGSS